jgi:hypothetical protein
MYLSEWIVTDKQQLHDRPGLGVGPSLAAPSIYYDHSSELDGPEADFIRIVGEMVSDWFSDGGDLTVFCADVTVRLVGRAVLAKVQANGLKLCY